MSFEHDGSLWAAWGEAALTATGFFWKAGWAFVLGYAISAMIQAFVPKARLTRFMGDDGVRSVGLATVFGAASSSCSFAALATARSLVQKGAGFLAAVAFMFASTNLVIELGILIFLFLGVEFVVAEIAGGLVLIAISGFLMRRTRPNAWFDAARRKVEQASTEEDDFDWRRRIRSVEGWTLVGHHFVMEWRMVWREIVVGFTVAGFVAVLVPHGFWEAIFLTGHADTLPAWLVALENALVAPLVAAATFIGSMGNIPLATVLAANGVLFAGIMGFIYSDLMVPPLVAVNARYYGWRVALYIAGMMYVSIVLTALIMDATFGMIGWRPTSERVVADVVRFSVDYTLWLNVGFAVLTVALIGLHRAHVRAADHGGGHDHGSAGPVQTVATWTAVALVVVGLLTAAFV